MKCIVVDDEPIALAGMADFVERTPFLSLVSACKNAMEALQVISEGQVELVFLDINMPQLTGVDMLESIENPPMIIFTTAYPDYALKGFELNAIDYILKPISYAKFLKASQKAYKAFCLSQKSEELNEDDFIYIKVDKRLLKVKIAEILYIESLKDYISIHTAKQNYITYLSLNKMVETLPSKSFAQVHKSYIINIHAVDAIDGNVLEVNKKAIPLGRAYKENVLVKILNNRLLKK
ncbi:response regulator transcription factor [Lentimicrobium sp. L6]|uniref:LytR/AlgR family response regulator transcription factor n=1 Tax=Lentimicrobium sp. L6 TaxID=2735916 RepID=UPI0015561975|nr:LytTR family DNA-binding domain-containing protein [Lentimicrobium sp. L6]NPD83519.1 response regulator transcription factor [Lentimicrobium sp. L6]